MSPSEDATGSVQRCRWVGDDPLYQSYHDDEWGVPVVDDATLFECLTLEGAQAGLSWRTVLGKREGYRDAFKGFDPGRVARMGERSVERLLQNPGVVRHRGKIESTLSNARRVLEIQRDHGSFAAFLWEIVGGRPVQNHFRNLSEVPSETDGSRMMSKLLKKKGFRFVGPTTCYAFMQATGMVNDHETGCFRYAECADLAPPPELLGWG